MTRVKRALSTALVEAFHTNEQLVNTHQPTAGDVGIFRIVEGDNKYMRDTNGANHYLFCDDLILAVFGNRYATNQVEAYVPNKEDDILQLVGRGGVVGTIKSMHGKFKNPGIVLKLEGYAVDSFGQVINTTRIKPLNHFNPNRIHAKVILSLGSSMDSGKTTTAAYLCKGLMEAGVKAAYMKLTGTTYNKDPQYVYDRGAILATDFSAFGYPSTYLCDKPTLLNLYQSLYLDIEAKCDPEIIVVEIADGILQRETQMLLEDQSFMSTVSDVILSCGDSLGAMAGTQYLEQLGIIPFALSGLFTASDLLVEEVKYKVDMPILNLNDLTEPSNLFKVTKCYEQAIAMVA